MNRRSLLRFLGLAPVAAVVPAASETVFAGVPLPHGRWVFVEFPAQRLDFEGEPAVFDEPITVTFGGDGPQTFDIDEEPT